MQDIADLFKTIALPVMPEVGLTLISTLDDPKVSIANVQRLIAQDPVLTAKLLALANSAAFGLPRKVAELDSAMKLVGLGKIRALALSACLHNAFSVPEGIDSTEFWRYSMECAGYAQWLAGGLDEALDVDPQRAWLVGLMLRLGQLIICSAHPDLVAQIEQTPRAAGERWTRERDLAGFDEGEVTAELARRWNFPDAIVHALLLSCDPQLMKPIPPLAAVAHLAGLLAESADNDAKVIDTLPVPVMDSLALKYGWMKSGFPDSGSFIRFDGLV